MTHHERIITSDSRPSPLVYHDEPDARTVAEKFDAAVARHRETGARLNALCRPDQELTEASFGLAERQHERSLADVAYYFEKLTTMELDQFLEAMA